MLLGVDFDNTIVSYDTVFHLVARERGLIPAEIEPSKDKIRDYLRACGREDEWIELQGYVYGARIAEAEPFPGVTDFFLRCRQIGLSVVIVSHKTLYPYAGPRYNLHRAAFQWLEEKGFFELSTIGISHDQVFLELTKKEKIQRIAALGCTHFIDDLPEFLSEAEFPTEVIRILFDPNDNYPSGYPFPRMRSWTQVNSILSEVTE
jgi:hypothetical protein